MLRSLFKHFLVLTLFISLFSCAIKPDPMRLLDSSTSSYEKAIRWAEFDRAKSFHKKAPNLSDLERRRLKFYRVTGYATLQKDTPDKYNSYLTVQIKYYKSDQPVIKTITVRQHWKREKNGKLWYLGSPFPKFR